MGAVGLSRLYSRRWQQLQVRLLRLRLLALVALVVLVALVGLPWLTRQALLQAGRKMICCPPPQLGSFYRCLRAFAAHRVAWKLEATQPGLRAVVEG